MKKLLLFLPLFNWAMACEFKYINNGSTLVDDCHGEIKVVSVINESLYYKIDNQLIMAKDEDQERFSRFLNNKKQIIKENRNQKDEFNCHTSR